MAGKTAVEPTMPKRTLQEGIDSLWKHQLRKENAALLEKQEANAKLLQSLATETVRNRKEYEERLAALETKLLNLQSEERKDRHAFERWGEELASMQAQMGGVLSTIDKCEQQLSSAQVAAPGQENPSSRSGSTEKRDVSDTTPRTNGTITSTAQQAPSTAKTSNTFPAQVKTPTTNAELHPTGRDIEITTSFTKPVSRSRSRGQSVETSTPIPPPAQAPAAALVSRPSVKAPAPAAASKPAPPAAQPPKIPRLHQGTGSLKAYLDRATVAYDSFPGTKDKKFEIEFVASLIKGMRDDDEREVLVAELQQQHQSRTKKDGKVEILCKWRDVGEGMKSAKLIKVGSKKGNGHVDRLLKELMD